MDWQNEESDHSSVENLRWDENDTAPRTKNVTPLNSNVRCQGVQVGIGICKEIKGFTSALENLELERSHQDVELRTNDVHTDHFDSEQEETVPMFKTREIPTFQLVIQGPEILNFQGTRHSSTEIAPYWKKDSRMWLWKSVRLAGKMRSTRTKIATPTSTLCHKEFS